MLRLKKYGWVVVSASCLLASIAISQDGVESSSTVNAAPAPAETTAEQVRLDQLAMRQMMTSQAMLTKAKEQLMSDDQIAERIAREILMQEMVKDKEYLAMVRDGLSADSEDEPAMKMLVDKISAAKSKMLKDENAVMSMTQEMMVRQLAANRIAMMSGGRFDSDDLKELDKR
ncbi:hypothetical protein [Allorhodopirellula heiligendammensis]|uniref:Uncharacterized protein n=1 Tax=Allorhodopirellula heiligendammensis TaxID=2714739 RepID=A0A5C6BTN0_9BACT|nr:hypothetical protein [Allorhodopirellula heiligendammensis]TWU15573.1 hypothetical protein Poly21_27700 [Allorhodopirellula heiligendammensis]